MVKQLETKTDRTARSTYLIIAASNSTEQWRISLSGGRFAVETDIGEDAMLSIDWRSPAAYEHARTISAAGFAWEYLRRDADYHRDFDKISRQRATRASALAMFSKRWGLRFPARSQASA
jgi:hypothetical protein